MNHLTRLTDSIKAKLFFCFLCISLIALLAGAVGLIPFRSLENSLLRIGHDNIQSLLRINKIKESQSRIVLAEHMLLIRHLSDLEIRSQCYADMDTAYQNADTASQGFESLDLTPEQRDTWRVFRAAWDAWAAKQHELLNILKKQEELFHQGIHSGREFNSIADQALDLAFSDLREYRTRANHLLDVLVGMINSGAVDAINGSLATAATFRQWQIGLLAAAFFLSMLLSLWLSGLIAKPILKSVAYISLVADGNLRQDVEAELLGMRGEIGLLAGTIQRLIESQRREAGMFRSIAGGDYTGSVQMRSRQDELGMAVGRMVNTTNEALSQVHIAANQVTYGASAINSASQTLAQGAIETASSLEEISASMTQIGEKTHANAANADEADKLAASSQAAVGRGYEAVAEMIAAMKDLQTTSAQITVIVKLIDDIAFQTNLLALNAAVEAAHAGRHGRGFSVVADEVRNLAGRSAKAAKDTAQMLEITVEKLEKGAVLAEHTDSILREIVDNAAQVADLFREIAKSSNEQSLGIGQIASGLSQIDRVTQHNTLTAGETASAAVALLRQAENLRTLMERFSLRDDGSATDIILREQKEQLALLT